MSTQPKKRILAVDDRPNIILLIKTKLTAHGYEVETAYTGKNALEIIPGFQPDLVLLDIMMPDMDGFEVFEHMLANRDSSHIPVIFLTASGQTDHEVRARDMGAVHFLTKPFSPNNLLSVVNSVLESGQD